ncbi:MAG: Gfo/Idh/MocA family protein [Verrucomicrobiota bacterium]
MTRRRFLQEGSSALALAAAATYVPTTFAAEPRARRVGLIGTGWYGKCDLWRLLQVAPVEIVSLSDVDRRLLDSCADLAAKKQKSGRRPRTYSDYRKMLAEKDLDLVLIATPDHWHALPMIEACQAGADLYCQKPTGVDVVESQAMLAAARKYNRVVQIGTQRRSTPHLIEAKKRFIDSGDLGDIVSVDVCCYWQMRNRDTLQSAPDTAPPDHLDYEQWVGPAPFRPYNKIVHPRGWRAFMEYGNGIVGDMCVHMLDMVRWMLDLGWPSTITSWGGILGDRAGRANISDTQTATFDFPKFQVTWNHRTWGSMPDPDYPWAAIIRGTKGTLKASVFRYDFIPAHGGPVVHRDQVMELEQYPEDKTEPDLERHVAPAIRGHMKNLLECVETRAKPVADIEQGHISSACCLLANLSMQLGRTLKWDPATHQVVGDAEANRLLARPYRTGYTHPTPAAV